MLNEFDSSSDPQIQSKQALSLSYHFNLIYTISLPFESLTEIFEFFKLDTFPTTAAFRKRS